MRSLITTLVIAMALLVTASAAAQAEDVLTATAKDLYHQAKDARSQDDWTTCYAKAKAAWGVQRHPKIAAALGDCALDLGKARESAEHLSFFLEHRSPGAQAALVAYVEKRLSEAKSTIGAVRLQWSVPAATVLVDGQAVDGQPGDGKRLVFVEPGTHQLIASHPGYQQLERQLVVAAGDELEVSLTLVKAPGPSNGDSPGGASTAVLVIGYGVAVVGLGIGVGLTVASTGEANEADETTAALEAAPNPRPCPGDPRCQQVQDGREARDSLANGAMAAYLIGGAALVGTSLYWLLSRAAEPVADSAARVRLVPALSPTLQGLWLTAPF